MYYKLREIVDILAFSYIYTGQFFMLLLLSAVFFSKLSFKKNAFRCPDEDPHFVGPYLGPNSVILLLAHPASFAHKFLCRRVPASPGMQ